VAESEQKPESLVERLRELADRRQKAAERERRRTAQNLLNAASGYRALADALERQPSLSWMQPRGVAARMTAGRGEVVTLAGETPSKEATGLRARQG
jgi:hypothetical protein